MFSVLLCTYLEPLNLFKSTTLSIPICFTLKLLSNAAPYTFPPSFIYAFAKAEKTPPDVLSSKISLFFNLAA